MLGIGQIQYAMRYKFFPPRHAVYCTPSTSPYRGVGDIAEHLAFRHKR